MLRPRRFEQSQREVPLNSSLTSESVPDHMAAQSTLPHLAANSFAPLLWYFDLPNWVKNPLAPGNIAHNYAVPLRLHGSLNVRALEDSFYELLRRQPMLRSIFRFTEAGLMQQILPSPRIELPIVDLSDLSEDEKETRVRQILIEDAETAFALDRGPLLRISLLRLGEDNHVLLLTTHHAVCDDWSVGILTRELFAIYASFKENQPSPLPEISYQYRDYVNWLNARLRSSELEKRLNFWRESLGSGRDFHHVVPDYPRRVPRSFRGTHESTVLSQDLGNAIKGLAQRERVSAFMVMIAALQILLRRYSGDDDIGVGTCVANRPLPQLEGLIGPFANVSVLRTNLSGDPTFRDVLQRVRKVSLQGYSYQDLPFGTLVQALQPTPDPARNPLYQFLFVLLNAPNEPWESPDLKVQALTLDTGTTRYELNLWVKIQDAVEIDLQYNCDLFEAQTIRKMLDDYRTVLENMSFNAEASISDLTITPRTTNDRVPRFANDATAASAAPQGSIEARLCKLWESVLDHRPINVHDDFFAMGGDSLRASRLFARIEQAFHRALPVGTLIEAPTVAALAQIIAGEDSSDSCVVNIQRGASRPPLFCIPGQTGSVLMYRSLAEHLGTDQPVYGLQSLGLDGKHAPLSCIEDMAANFIGKVKTVQPHGPYFLTGFCMGGTIAFEMAQQLQQQGERVGLLAFIGTYNWNMLEKVGGEFWFRVEQWCFSWTRGGLRWKQLRQQGWSSILLIALPDRSDSLRKFSEFWNQPAAEAVSDCNRRAALSYKPHSYPGRILHIRPSGEYSVYKKKQLSLAPFVAGGLEEVVIPGHAHQLLEGLAVRKAATVIKASIDGASCGSRIHDEHESPCHQ